MSKRKGAKKQRERRPADTTDEGLLCRPGMFGIVAGEEIIKPFSPVHEKKS